MIKISAPWVFDGEKFLCENSIVVLDDSGFVRYIDQHPTHWDGVQKWEEGILCPAFINAHCHLELSHLKAKIPQHTGMTGFIQHIIQSPLPHPATIQHAITQADQQMWEAGIQAVGDICNTAQTIPVKQHSKLAYHSFIELLERANAPAKPILVGSELQQRFTAHALKATLTAHAPYTVSLDLWQDILDHQPKDDTLITIHYNESQQEKEGLQRYSGDLWAWLSRIHAGKPIPHLPYNTWIKALPERARLCLVHGTFIETEDLKYIQQCAQGQSLQVTHCICIKANQYIHDAIPPLGDIIAQSMDWCIGTDSLASNDTLSVWEEIKTIHQCFPKIPMAQLLRAATSVGATTLGYGASLGRLALGYQSGVVHISHADHDGLKPQSRVQRVS